MKSRRLFKRLYFLHLVSLLARRMLEMLEISTTPLHQPDTIVHSSICLKPSFPFGGDLEWTIPSEHGGVSLLQLVLVYSHWGLLPDLCITQRPVVHNCDPAVTLVLVPSPSYNAPSQQKTNTATKGSSSSRTRCSSGARSHTSRDRPLALQGVSLASFVHILSLQGLC